MAGKFYTMGVQDKAFEEGKGEGTRRGERRKARRENRKETKKKRGTEEEK